MTAKTEDLKTSLPGTTSVSSAASATSLIIDTVPARMEARVLNITDFHRTGSSVAETVVVPTKVDRLYPHLFEEEGAAGQVRRYLENALADARLALEAYSEGDLEAVGTRLTQIAVAMAGAHSLTHFNESLGAVVSFVRRATLCASGGDTTLSSLNALAHVLNSAVSDPMLDLDEASGLTDLLTNEGWHGEHGIAEALLAALLDDGAEVHSEHHVGSDEGSA